jgi:hypothetical protein
VVKWKKSISPPTYEGWNTSPSNLWKWIFYLWTL